MPNPQKSLCLPIDLKFDDHTVVYSLFNPIKAEVFNFNEFILNLDVLDVQIVHPDNSNCHSIAKTLIL